MVISLFAVPTALAQGLVDPSKVAPEHREAAEKRRAEQLRQRECARRADQDMVVPRDRTAYLNGFLDAVAAMIAVLCAAPVAMETVDVRGGGAVARAPFACTETTRSTAVRSVCFDE